MTTLSGTTQSPGKRRSLLSDDSGATMVMGVFMALMVVGMIYYVWGIGGTIIYRERMQDAADSGAFGASVYAAAGMNLIAFMNVLMAVFGTIGAAARLLQDFASWTIAADWVECLACIASIVGDIFGGCQAPDECGGLEAHEAEDASLDSVWSGVAQAMDAINQGLHVAQTAIAYGAFVGGETLAVDATHFSPNPVSFGVMVPGNVFQRPGRIQSEDDDTTWACSRGSFPNYEFIETPAFLLADGIALIAYEPINLSWIAGEAHMLITAEDRANHYCNNGMLTFQRVPHGSWLGDHSFQNYVVDYHRGSLPYGWSQQGVQAANWGREGSSAPSIFGLNLSSVQELHRLSISDAEYYYEQTEDDASGHDWMGPTLLPDPTNRDHREEWLFHPRWRARLRRFHIDTSMLGSLGSSAIQEVIGVIVH